MVMQADGTAYNVDWYFVTPSTPKLSQPQNGSNNWLKPDSPTGSIREVVGAPRPWRNGSTPSYVGVDARPGGAHPVAGLLSWWQNGAPGPGSGGLRWDGSRGFTNGPGPGIFPPFPPSGTPTLTSSTGRLITPGSITPGLEYTWDAFLGLNLTWAKWETERVSPPMLWQCSKPAVLWISNDANVHMFPLKCTGINSMTGASTWVDVNTGFLSPGEVLTLTP